MSSLNGFFTSNPFSLTGLQNINATSINGETINMISNVILKFVDATQPTFTYINNILTLNLPYSSALNSGILSNNKYIEFNSKQEPITVSSPLIKTVNALSIQQGNVSTNGYISSSDWTTFNSKQNALTVSSPLTKTGDLLTVSQSNASTNGYLSNTDWTTFNSKQEPITVSSPLIKTGNALSIQQSNASTNGYLSSTDWTTFNNKIGTLPYANATGQDGIITSVDYIKIQNGGGGGSFDFAANHTYTGDNTFTNSNFLLSGILNSTRSNCVYYDIFTGRLSYGTTPSNGAQGAQGIQGIQGAKGDTGAKGDKGDTGVIDYTLNNNWSGVNTFSNASFNLSGIPSATTTYCLYYNYATKSITYGVAPAGANLLNSSNIWSQPNDFQNTVKIALQSDLGDEMVVINNTTKQLYRTAKPNTSALLTTINSWSGSTNTFTGNLTVNATGVVSVLGQLKYVAPQGITANVLYWDSLTNLITRGTAPSGNALLTSANTWSGTNLFNNTSTFSNTTTMTGQLAYTAPAASATAQCLYWNTGTNLITRAAIPNVNSLLSTINTFSQNNTFSGTLSVGLSATFGSTITASFLPNAVGDRSVFWDSTTKQFSHQQSYLTRDNVFTGNNRFNGTTYFNSPTNTFAGMPLTTNSTYIVCRNISTGNLEYAIKGSTVPFSLAKPLYLDTITGLINLGIDANLLTQTLDEKLTIKQSTNSQDGYLSSTNFNTFNNKENVLTFSLPLKRTGNAITIPDLQISSSSQTNTLMGWNAGVGITSGLSNFCLGTLSGFGITSGSYNFLCGGAAGSQITTGNQNIIFQSIGITTGSNNIFLGINNDTTNTALSGSKVIGFTNHVNHTSCVVMGNNITTLDHYSCYIESIRNTAGSKVLEWNNITKEISYQEKVNLLTSANSWTGSNSFDASFNLKNLGTTVNDRILSHYGITGAVSSITPAQFYASYPPPSQNNTASNNIWTGNNTFDSNIVITNQNQLKFSIGTQQVKQYLLNMSETGTCGYMTAADYKNNYILNQNNTWTELQTNTFLGSVILNKGARLNNIINSIGQNLLVYDSTGNMVYMSVPQLYTNYPPPSSGGSILASTNTFTASNTFSSNLVITNQSQMKFTNGSNAITQYLLNMSSTGDVSYITAGQYKDNYILNQTNNWSATQTFVNKIGVGTTSPSFPIHVSTYVDGYISFYYMYSGGVGGPTAGTVNIGIYASNRIACQEFNAFSDERIKKDVRDINDGEALEVLRKIEPKIYNYKDVMTRGSKPVYGFIAQQIDKVLDYGVNKITDYIPSILSKATLLNKNTLKLEGKCDDMPTNTKLKIYIDEKNTEKIVVIDRVIDENTILIKDDIKEEKDIGIEGEIKLEEKDWRDETKDVFVYGREVDDFHILNKDAIYTITVAALQEVDRKQQEIITENKILKDRLAILEAKFEILLNK